MTDAQLRAVEWLANGKTGLSSETMCFLLAFGVARNIPEAPHDPADFNRCLQFLFVVPEARPHLYKLSELSPHWAALVENWDRIERSFIDEAGPGWTKSGTAPLTYRLMRDIITEAK